MFRRRLTLALSLLATAAVLQGLGAAAALSVAQHKVEQGRVASDIQLGFVELKASEQRLRAWVAQHQQGATPAKTCVNSCRPTCASRCSS